MRMRRNVSRRVLRHLVGMWLHQARVSLARQCKAKIATKAAMTTRMCAGHLCLQGRGREEETTGTEVGSEGQRARNSAERYSAHDVEGGVGEGAVMEKRERREKVIVLRIWLPVAAGAVATRRLSVMLLHAWLQWALMSGHTRDLVSRATRGVARALSYY
jgi:hypothetical protein